VKERESYHLTIIQSQKGKIFLSMDFSSGEKFIKRGFSCKNGEESRLISILIL